MGNPEHRMIHSRFSPIPPLEEASRPVEPQGPASAALRTPLVKWGVLAALALVGALALGSWGWLAFHHARDRFLTNHPPGVWMALAKTAADGELYPALHDHGRYGGTRYAPIPIAAHAMLSRVTGELLLSGKLWNYAQGLLVAGTLFVVVRSRARAGGTIPWALALALAMGWMACQSGMMASLTVRNDGLPLALQLMAVALVVRLPGAAPAALAGGLCALAALSKMSAVWAAGALGLWLLATNWRLCLTFTLVYSGALAGGLYGVNLMTDGRFFQSLSGSTGTLWKDGGTVFFAPFNMAWHMIDSAQAGFATVPLAAVAVLVGALRRSWSPFHLAWICCVGSTLLLYADVGIAENHLIDLLALSAVLTADLWSGSEPTPAERRSLGGGLSPAQAVVGALVVWTAGVSWTRHALIPVKDGVKQHLSGEPDPKLDPHLLHSVVRADESVLSEDPYWVVSVGQRPTVLDPFMLMRFGVKHPDWITELEGRIRAREFEVIVLLREADPGDPWYRTSAFGPGPVAAIRESYALDERIDGYYVYRRPGAAPAKP